MRLQILRVLRPRNRSSLVERTVQILKASRHLVLKCNGCAKWSFWSMTTPKSIGQIHNNGRSLERRPASNPSLLCSYANIRRERDYMVHYSRQHRLDARTTTASIRCSVWNENVPTTLPPRRILPSQMSMAASNHAPQVRHAHVLISA